RGGRPTGHRGPGERRPARPGRGGETSWGEVYRVAAAASNGGASLVGGRARNPDASSLLCVRSGRGTRPLRLTPPRGHRGSEGNLGAGAGVCAGAPAPAGGFPLERESLR